MTVPGTSWIERCPGLKRLIRKPTRDAFTIDRMAVLSGGDLILSQAHCVYVLCRGWQVLYVGLSQDLNRPFRRDHHRMGGRVEADDHMVIFWPAGGYPEASQLEASLIRLLRPAWNVTGNPGARPAPSWRDRRTRVPAMEASE